MTATEPEPSTGRRTRRTNRTLVGMTGAVVVAFAVVLVAAEVVPTEPVPPLPPPPDTSRPDLQFEARARRDDGVVVLIFSVGVESTAPAPVRLYGLTRPRSGPGEWVPHERNQRLDGGQVVVHLGLGSPPRFPVEGIMGPAPEPGTLTIGPGESRSAVIRVEGSDGDGEHAVSDDDLAAVEEIRVCLWDVEGRELNRMGGQSVVGQPLVCADEDL